MKCASLICEKLAASGQKYCSKEHAPFANLVKEQTFDEERLSLRKYDVIEAQKRARYVAKKRGYPELADDFAQELALHWLSGHGKHQTVDQFFIDYLRTLYGRSGVCSDRSKYSERRNYVDLTEARDIAAPSRDLEPKREYSHLFSGRESVIYELYFVEERSGEAIGEYLGVTESRVSQLLASIKEVIKRHVVLMDGYERIEWDNSFLSFSIKWMSL
jgi:hypothetical protein